MKQQILVIDDSVKIHPLIKAILAEEPVDVHSATDPNYGLVLAASICPDLILLDVDMPGMNGFEACKKLKADPATAKCPVIFLTARVEVNEKVQGFGLGAADYMTKPFNHAELIARVRASLRTHQVIRSLESKALIDPVTGLGNRTMFDRRLSAEICLRVRSKSPLSVTLIQIDHFAKMSTLYGHQVVERVLVLIGKILGEASRTEDVLCHFGDGKFGVVSPHTTRTEAVFFAERQREILAGKAFAPQGAASSILGHKCIGVTFTFGVVDASDAHDRSVAERAEDALYLAQQSGCNPVRAVPPVDTARAVAA